MVENIFVGETSERLDPIEPPLGKLLRFFPTRSLATARGACVYLTYPSYSVSRYVRGRYTRFWRVLSSKKRMKNAPACKPTGINVARKAETEELFFCESVEVPEPAFGSD